MFLTKFKNRKSPKYLYIISLGIFLFIGVGYSVLNSTLSIEGTVTKEANSWSIFFANIDDSTSNITADQAVRVVDGTTLDFAVTLNNPGDKYEFTFDIINNGTLDALIKTIDKTSLTDEQKKYLEYSVTYNDGTNISDGDLLKVRETKKAHVIVRYKDLRAKDYYPDSDITMNFTMSINYYQPLEEEYTLRLGYYKRLDGTEDFVRDVIEYKTTNISQQITLESNKTERGNTIVCNNGAIPSINGEGIVSISNIKSDVYCDIDNNKLTDFIKNADDSSNYILILSDHNLNVSEKTTVSSNKNITINLNGKNVIVNGSFNDNQFIIENLGNLNIISDKNYELNSNRNLIENIGGYLVLKDVNVSSSNTDNINCATIKVSSGNVSMDNSNISSSCTTDSSTILTNDQSNVGAMIHITNSELSTTNASSLIKIGGVGNLVMNISNNTKFSISQGKIIDYVNENSKSSVYICNSQALNANVYDFGNIPSSNGRIFYSSNTVFSDGTNIPTSSDNVDLSRVVKTDIACLE